MPEELVGTRRADESRCNDFGRGFPALSDSLKLRKDPHLVLDRCAHPTWDLGRWTKPEPITTEQLANWVGSAYYLDFANAAMIGNTTLSVSNVAPLPHRGTLVTNLHARWLGGAGASLEIRISLENAGAAFGAEIFSIGPLQTSQMNLAECIWIPPGWILQVLCIPVIAANVRLGAIAYNCHAERFPIPCW